MTATKSRKPSQANLRRACSTTYYALFHCIAKSGANLLIGTGTARSNKAWLQVYRALDHGTANTACKNAAILVKFPQDIQDLANMFVTMQTKRHRADYDPAARFSKSDVGQDIANVRDLIQRFSASPIDDRRAFAAFVLFKRRP